MANICVIGGGPAGAATAIKLVSMGHSVILLETQDSPGQKIGASLPANILHLLEALGVRRDVEDAGFIRSGEIAVFWDNERPELRKRPGPPGLYVDRSKFDQILLDAAISAGAVVVQGAKASRPQRMEGGMWQIPVRTNNGLIQYSARIVVDASGSGRMAEGKRSRQSVPTLALYANWLADRALPDRTIGAVEAGQDHWLWSAPLNARETVVALFLDPHRVSGLTQGALRQFYVKKTTQSRLVSRFLSHQTPGKIQSCDASAWVSEPVMGNDYIRVGDACLRLDPISSQGLQSSLSSALQAAVVVNTVLKKPGNTSIAQSFYTLRQSQRLDSHLLHTAEQYRAAAMKYPDAFWSSRAGLINVSAPVSESVNPDQCSLSTVVGLTASTSVVDVPVALGDFVELRPALNDPALKHPIAFFDGCDISPVFQELGRTGTVAELFQHWSKKIPEKACQSLMDLLWTKRILRPL